MLARDIGFPAPHALVSRIPSREPALHGTGQQGYGTRFMDFWFGIGVARLCRRLAQRWRSGFLPTLALAALLASPAAAQEAEPDYVGTFRDWHVFTYEEGGNKVCYIVTQPTRAQGDYTARGAIFLLVTNRPAEDEQDVVSIITGYTYEPESEVEVSISNRQFQMFTLDDTAWNYAGDDDRQMVQAMIAGSSMVAIGTSNRGTVTTDTYSLLGFTAARNQMVETCN